MENTRTIILLSLAGYLLLVKGITVINTWSFTDATKSAFDVLANSKHHPGDVNNVLDAIVAGCNRCEIDQCDHTVGYGASPDTNGETTLDAMILDGTYKQMGAVGQLRRVKAAIKVARAVLHYSAHSILVGDGALQFAKVMGFQEESLTTSFSETLFRNWQHAKCQPNYFRNVYLQNSSCPPYRPIAYDGDMQSHPAEDTASQSLVAESNHDTIGIVVLDSHGNMGAGTSSNGANHKIAGRVGDATIPGAGAYVDSKIGGAAATGDGDIMMRFLPSSQAVQHMANGFHPRVACHKALSSIGAIYPNFKGGLVCLNRFGEYAGVGYGWNFTFSVQTSEMLTPRICGEVVCGNCTLKKEADLPVIGRSLVRVCMSCILSQASKQTNFAATPSTNSSGSLPLDDKKWEPHTSHSLMPKSDSLIQSASDFEQKDFTYTLDFGWDHPWPKPPIPPFELERLDALSSFEIMDTPNEDVFDIICDLASNALKCPIAAISLLAEDREWFKASVGLAQNEIPRSVSFCAHAIMTKEPLIVSDTLADKRFVKNPLVTGAAKIRFYAAAPICTSKGYLLGTVFVFDTVPRTHCDVATLEKLSNVTMKNLEDRRCVLDQMARDRSHIRATGNQHSEPNQSQPPPLEQPSPCVDRIAEIKGTSVAIPSNAVVSNQSENAEISAGPKMESMLMDLLCRTTQTQQQLATQQGAMFTKLGRHSADIDKLASAVARMEAKLSALTDDDTE
ncbi:unnamed protein product [Albugo candida]|nr:unnamed protein product [Albugo candida]|eukprot:CCI49305.1 unnamed protein product [Albugo candida]